MVEPSVVSPAPPCLTVGDDSSFGLVLRSGTRSVVHLEATVSSVRRDLGDCCRRDGEKPDKRELPNKEDQTEYGGNVTPEGGDEL